MSLLAGFIALALLGAAVGSPAQGGTTVAAANVKAGFGWLDTAIGKLVDPSVPAIAQHGTSSTASTTSSTGASSASATPASSSPPATTPVTVNPPRS